MPRTPSFDFSGQTTLVTGASRGIGLAVARAFALAGADLWILAEDEGIENAAYSLAAESGRHVNALRCDISDRSSVVSALGRIPQLDILINNAGYQPRTPMNPADSSTDAAFRRVIDVNVMGTYHVTRLALDRMNDGGRIIFTSSIWGKTGAAEYSGYCASKHATIGFMRALALDLGSRQITVNAVCPGWVETEGAMWTVREIAGRQQVSVQDLVASYIAGQPLPGIMGSGDLAGMYLFLASDAAKDITGQAINVDRGIFMG
ncbi:SDR family NAD(P)-dependent oxidoreductase [Aestuariivirga sp.]|uniref:SDR family NAD(P)-dependent oxidoreductase n=1 Tax=Aestuariivirga sp. TaxID=2650926 RepID=UPI00391D5811